MFIDAAYIKDTRKLWITERNREGIRTIKSTNPPYVYYYEDPDGLFKAIHDDNVRLKRAFFTKRYDMTESLQRRQGRGIQCYETDVDPVWRYLEEKYPNDEDTPPLHVQFIDIEVAQVEGMGYEGSKPWNALGEVTAITLYNLWEKLAYTIALVPPGMSKEEAQELLDDKDHPDGFGALSEENGYYLCDSEEELLETFLQLIEPADVITGWNSEFYDLPYLINRIRVLFGGEDPLRIAQETGDHIHPLNPSPESVSYLERFNLFPCLPKVSLKESYGRQQQVYRLYGRVHLDYMLLFQKFTKNTIGELHSYALDYVLNEVVQQSKVHYDGTLDELREQKFRTFIAYNRQDTMGLAAIEEKLTIMDQANTMAHMAGVTLDKVLGSVVIIEQAILRRLHKQGRVCFDKPSQEEGEQIPGAFVVEPNPGLYDWVVSFDIASLYPSVIRMLNISPETMVGQFKTTATDKLIRDFMGGDRDKSAEAWAQVTGVLEYHAIMEGSPDLFTFVHSSGHEDQKTGAEWKEWLSQHNYAISGNATVFDMNRKGIVAECIDDWFHDRIKSKKKAGEFEKKLNALKKEWEPPKDAPKEGSNQPLVVPAEIIAEMHELTKAAAKWNTIQMAKKIFMNSTYGAFLNRFFRFYDQRLGKSVTLSGRVITKHMIKKASEVITGNYDFDRNAIIYGDTDSVYAKLDWYIQQNGIDTSDFKKLSGRLVKIADELGTDINASFFDFVKAHFLVDDHRAKAIEAVRDVVAPRGLFKSVKKRYALWVINVEGKPKDEVKIMGMETRRSDTPKVLQKFIESCIEKVLKENAGYPVIYDYVQDYRKNVYRKSEPWNRGSPQRIKNLTNKVRELETYENMQSRGLMMAKKPLVHFSLGAAMSTNELIKINNETRWEPFQDGDKIEIIKLRRNDYGYKTVAIRAGETYIPDWFRELPFDNKAMEEKMFDKKLHNTLGVILEWDFTAEDNHAEAVFEKEDFFA